MHKRTVKVLEDIMNPDVSLRQEKAHGVKFKTMKGKIE